jgi:hypothetical protein
MIKWSSINKNIINKAFLYFFFCFLISCSVEQRIKEHSYTNEWCYIDKTRFQVYKTKLGKKYILVLNKKQTRYKRKYFKNINYFK